ncbi:hypothetical protein [Streptomyces sp. 3213.3]|uniref:hypothetical protein n=1 Tax=Streptomyces sp. 3213.3 TaxID=1855348 RepID=UPI00190EC5D5|nr:hypothetical protein [Streptomyces sp. 3213.3]
MTHVTQRTYRTRGLLSARRIPLAYAKGAEGEWGLVMHDMFGWDEDDYDRPDYGPLCRDGGELAVFTTEPCMAKAHGPHFEYLRDGRFVCGFSFETLSYGVGDHPDLLSPALTAARLIGPHAEYDQEDRAERTVRAISAFFSLPDPDFSLT